jgi:hypothetical protein
VGIELHLVRSACPNQGVKGIRVKREGGQKSEVSEEERQLKHAEYDVKGVRPGHVGKRM